MKFRMYILFYKTEVALHVCLQGMKLLSLVFLLKIAKWGRAMTVPKIGNVTKKHWLMLYTNAKVANGRFDCSVLPELLNRWGMKMSRILAGFLKTSCSVCLFLNCCSFEEKKCIDFISLFHLFRLLIDIIRMSSQNTEFQESQKLQNDMPSASFLNKLEIRKAWNLISFLSLICSHHFLMLYSSNLCWPNLITLSQR